MNKGLKIGLIVIGVVFLLGIGGCVYLVNQIKATSDADEYVICKNKIPSVKAVVGKRKITGVSSNISNNITQKTYTYSNVDKPSQDVYKYVKYLEENKNFLTTSNGNINNPSGTIQIAEKAAESGNIIIMEIKWDVGSYTISISYGKGTLNKADESK